jgi:hypothetical protein
VSEKKRNGQEESEPMEKISKWEAADRDGIHFEFFFLLATRGDDLGCASLMMAFARKNRDRLNARRQHTLFV